MKLASTLLFSLAVSSVWATNWYVDSEGGDDAAAGTSEAAAIRSLGRVNGLDVKPGDKVLFKRGGLWRGTLRPKSGEPGSPVLYSSYGTGPKPILQNSVSMGRESDWQEVEPGLWATRKVEPVVHEQYWGGTDCDYWNGSFQEGVKGAVRKVRENGETFVRVTCTAQPKRKSNLVQVWGPGLKNLPAYSILRMKVRASKPFPLGRLGLSLDHLPWTTAACGYVRGAENAELGPDWKTVEVLLPRQNVLDRAHFHFSIGDVLPLGGTFDFIPLGLWRAEVNASSKLTRDVGIFICDHGAKWGVKKWRKDACVKPLDYWDDRANERVFVRYDGNPAKAFGSIELALTQHVVEEGGCHDVVYDGFCVRYGGAHGWGGGGTRNIVIRNNDICWIGGGLQFWNVNAKGVRYPVRFGNGIEFWGECHNNLVERNRIWQIYDAALTNQTKDSPRTETDVVWRDNVVWQAEYSFEYWNHDPRSFTGNILVEHNTFVDAGYCWSHDQRPNPNGAHLMMYDNAAPTTNFVVRNNLFVRTTDRSTRFFNDWRVRNPAAKDGLEMSRNLYWMPENLICEYHVNGRERAQKLPIRLEPGKWGAGAAEFKRYQDEFKLDADSVYGEPRFVDEAKRDYRLKPGSFGSDLATDGGPLGARNMPGLDRDQSL